MFQRGRVVFGDMDEVGVPLKPWDLGATRRPSRTDARSPLSVRHLAVRPPRGPRKSRPAWATLELSPLLRSFRAAGNFVGALGPAMSASLPPRRWIEAGSSPTRPAPPTQCRRRSSRTALSARTASMRFPVDHAHGVGPVRIASRQRGTRTGARNVERDATPELRGTQLGGGCGDGPFQAPKSCAGN